jgi:predicted site-specific integrase-resolvase
MDTPPLLERSEAARRLHVSTRTVRRWGRLELLENVVIGPRTVLVTEESVDALIRAGRKDAAA